MDKGEKRRGQGDKSDGVIISNGMDHRTGRKTADDDELASKTRTRFHEQMRFLVDGTFRCSFRRTRGSMEHALKTHLFHRTGSHIMLWWCWTHNTRQALEMCAKANWKNTSMWWQLIRSCLFSLETNTGSKTKVQTQWVFVNCCVCGSRQKDVLDGVWDLARLAKDVRMWMPWKEHSVGANRPKWEKFILPVATSAAQITCGYSRNHMFNGSFRRNWSKREWSRWKHQFC